MSLPALVQGAVVKHERSQGEAGGAAAWLLAGQEGQRTVEKEARSNLRQLLGAGESQFHFLLTERGDSFLRAAL